MVYVTSLYIPPSLCVHIMGCDSLSHRIVSIIAWCIATPTSVSARGSLPRGGSVYDGGDSVCHGVSAPHGDSVCDGEGVCGGSGFNDRGLHHSCGNE